MRVREKPRDSKTLSERKKVCKNERGRQQGEGKEAERERERGRNAVVVNQMSSDSIH